MTIKVDKTFVVVLIISLLFGNLLYMWGEHIGQDKVEPVTQPIQDGGTLTAIWYPYPSEPDDTHNDEVAVMQEQIEIMRIQLSQLKPLSQ